MSITLAPSIKRDIMQWDSLNWSRSLDVWQSYLPKDIGSYSVLELGAKQGGLSLYFALQGCKHIVCSDISSPQEWAEPLHSKYGMGHIEYKSIDACEIDFPDSSMDIIAFKSVLGGVRKGAFEDRKQKMLDEVYRVLKPGGYLVFAENLQGHRLHMFLRRWAVSWAVGWEYLNKDAILSYLSSYQNFHYQSFGFSALLGRNEGQRQILALMDQKIQAYLPSQWHYIFAGVAQKPL